jgi:DNA-binding MarR family transcriptional regulator
MAPTITRMRGARRIAISAGRGILLTGTTNFVNSPVASDGRLRQAGRRMAPGLAARLREPKPPAKRAAAAREVDLGILNDRLGYFVRRLQVWVFQDFIRRLSGLDLSPAQFSVIVVIGANPGLSQAQLAATLGIERARLVRLLHRLEQRGLTERRRSTADGRRHALMLTRGGDKLLSEATRLAEKHEEDLRQRLGAKRHRTLLEMLRAF